MARPRGLATWFRRDPSDRVAALKRHLSQRAHRRLIDDWGMTENPKRANTGGAVLIPFRLWLKPIRASRLDVAALYEPRRPACAPKLARSALSGCAMAFAASVCALYKNIVIGVVASTEDKLDSTKDPSPTLPKAREFLRRFRPSCAADTTTRLRPRPISKSCIPETGR